jgi:hypothetical protein
MTLTDNPAGLRATLESSGASLKSLTVLAPQNDPFRVDTDAGHRDGQWLRDMMTELRLSGPRHLRGLHYALIGQPKPNGQPYTNTDADWQWLATPAKCARWLGYIPFDRIVDQRNDEPEVQLWTPPTRPYPFISNGGPIDLKLPDVSQFRPRAWLSGFTATQPYRLVLVGEKSSLHPVLSRVAARYQCDLYLPTGEISDTRAYQMARTSTEDNRPLVCFYVSDADPSGWQMPISLSRKLQAFKAAEFPELEFEVHRVALTPGQVREYGLPSTPLKDTEKRADRWQAAMGVAQTEIDALAALQPQLLERITREAVSPYFDATLAARVRSAEAEWEQAAQQTLDSAVDSEHMERLRAETAVLLTEKRDEIQQLLEMVRVNPAELGVKLPPTPPLPEADLSPTRPPLCSSQWNFTDQCHALIASKNYELGGDA